MEVTNTEIKIKILINQLLVSKKYTPNSKVSDGLKIKGGRKIYHTNTNQKKAGLHILIQQKNSLQTKKKYIRNKVWHYQMVKRSILKKM